MTNPIIIKLEVSLPNANPQTYEHIERLVLNQLNSPYIKVEVIEDMVK